jgi:chaperone modulatory protein CbpM
MQIDQTELIWLDEHHEVSLDELIEISGFSQEELHHLVEIGALIPHNPAEDNVTTNDLRFSSQCIVSIRTLSRLKHDFELEQNALDLMLVFLERIRNLELQLSVFNPTK